MKKISTKKREDYLNRLKSKHHYTIAKTKKRINAVVLCVIWLIFGIGIGIIAYPLINSAEVTVADPSAIDISDVPIQTIKDYVRDNKYLFPEFFPDVQAMIKELKPEPVVTPTPAPTPTVTPKAPNTGKRLEEAKDIKTFVIEYFKYYYDNFIGTQEFPLTKIGYISGLRSNKSTDRIYFSFYTPTNGENMCILYPDGSVDWNSLSGCSQLDVEKALQIMLDNVRV